jgi:hypothetical protein
MKETDSVAKERRLRCAARARLLARLGAQPGIDVGRWTRCRWGGQEMTKTVNEGGSFENFLEEEGILDDVDKSPLARRMKTSRTELDRLLDPDDVTLHTLYRAAEVLGKRRRVSFEEVDRPEAKP